jgi:hypothetical protein
VLTVRAIPKKTRAMAEQVDTSTIRERIAAWARLPDDRRPIAASVSTAELIALLHEFDWEDVDDEWTEAIAAYRGIRLLRGPGLVND